MKKKKFLKNFQIFLKKKKKFKKFSSIKKKKILKKFLIKWKNILKKKNIKKPKKLKLLNELNYNICLIEIKKSYNLTKTIFSSWKKMIIPVHIRLFTRLIILKRIFKQCKIYITIKY